VLRPFGPAGVDDLLTMDGDARVMRYIGMGVFATERAGFRGGDAG
jgi:hypothetical protein